MFARLKMGKTNVKVPAYASESTYVRMANEAMKKIKADLEYIINETENVTPEIMLEALKPTFEKSKEYCPVDTGDLRGSGYLEITSFRGQPTVEMGYGKGGHPHYTAYVHENLEMRHEPPTQAKWLERAVNEDIGNIIDRVAEGYQQVLGI
jgi:hypothetical protein